MPTYDYKCCKCSHVFEVFHSMSENPTIKCEKCGAKTKRMPGAGACIIFKGSGFYETDYKRKSGGSTGSSRPSKPKSESTPKETKSTDSKKVTES